MENKQRMKEEAGTEYLDKFLNAVLNDNAYCLEEGINTLKKIKQYELAVERGEHMDDEARDNHRSDGRVTVANMQLSEKCLWMVKELTTWSIDFFNNDVFTE